MAVELNIKTCEHCGAEINEGMRFCTKCGQPVPVITKCEVCGAEINPENFYCTGCGTALKQQVEEVQTVMESVQTTVETTPTYIEPLPISAEPMQAVLGNIQTVTAPAPKRSKKWIIFLVLSAVATFLISIVVIVGIILTPTIQYNMAIDAKESGDYKRAYNLFSSLGEYQDSSDQRTATIGLWAMKALGSSTIYEATELKNTVSLKSEDYAITYAAVLLYINEHGNSEHWLNYGATTNTQKVDLVLDMLPATYENASAYQRLFTALQSSYDASEMITKHKDIVKKCFSIEFVKDLAADDDAISYFLCGEWNTYSSGYYIEFYEKDDAFSSSYNLPWVVEPYGTKYYDIEGMIYYYEDANGNKLAKVYRFEIVDYNTIKVYCYKNNRTYTLYR